MALDRESTMLIPCCPRWKVDLAANAKHGDFGGLVQVEEQPDQREPSLRRIKRWGQFASKQKKWRMFGWLASYHCPNTKLMLNQRKTTGRENVRLGLGPHRDDFSGSTVPMRPLNGSCYLEGMDAPFCQGSRDHDARIDKLEGRVAALQRLSVGQLRQRFAELFGETTKASNRTWLIKRIVWRMQALAEGDLSQRAH